MGHEMRLRVARAIWYYDPYNGLFYSELLEQIEDMDSQEIVRMIDAIIEEDESGDVEEFEALRREIAGVA